MIRFLVASGVVTMVTAVAHTQPVLTSADLPQMLQITWRLGPDLPQGLQDSEVAIIDGTLISVGGFASGEKGVPGKPDKYPRGFLNKTWAVDLSGEQPAWKDLPPLPGAPRQGLFGGVVDDALYLWGGFSYDKPYIYREGACLTGRDGEWRWSKLPSLPWPMAGAGVAVVDKKIYVMGGAAYDADRFYTATSPSESVTRMGAQLIVFDPVKPDDGWVTLTECPGSPRWVHAVTAVAGDIYVFGGATGSDNAQGSYYTVVDNWKYNVASDTWSRLADLPISSANFPDNQIVFAERYILLVGGYPYSNVMNPDGTLREPYGTPGRYFADVSLFSDIYVYDTHTGEFGRANMMPLNNNLPSTVIAGNRIYMVGGEIEHAEIEGVHFGHHPDLLLIGEIREVQ